MTYVMNLVAPGKENKCFQTAWEVVAAIISGELITPCDPRCRHGKEGTFHTLTVLGQEVVLDCARGQFLIVSNDAPGCFTVRTDGPILSCFQDRIVTSE